MRDRSKSVKGRPADDEAPEGTNVLFDVWLVFRATTGVLDTALAPSGLTADEFGIYSVLTRDEATTPSELARWLAAPATTVSSTIKRLEARGHVTRVRNPDDGRSYLVRLTPAGRRAWEKAGTAFLPVLAEVEARLGPKQASVRRALALLRDSLDDLEPG